MKWKCPVLLALLPWFCCASEIPEPVLPAGVGVNIHFVTGHERDLDLIAAAGFKFIRMDFGWASIERRKGEFDWAGYDELLANLDARGLRPVFILDYSNPLYEEVMASRNPINGSEHRTTASPQHPESVAAFARWAAAAARHYRGRHVVWEIWNEPNISFWSPHPDVEQYTKLALATCRAVREADPESTLVGPASSGFPWDFLETFLKSGVLEYLNAVSVHPYRDYKRPPETAAADYARLRQLIDRYAPADRRGKIPVLSGEWGYASHRRGVSLDTQAAFASRQQLANLLDGVPLSIWYDWMNDGPDSDEGEHNFGTVYSDLKPKPAYVALKTLTHELGGYRIIKRLPTSQAKDYVLLCGNASGDQRLAAWTLGEEHQISIPIKSGGANGLKAARSTGEALTIEPHSDELKLDIGPAPLYVTLGQTVIE